jgi:predicted ester cyclase
MDSASRNLATARRWLLDVFNNHDVDAVPSIIAPSYVNVGTTERRGHTAGVDVIRQADSWAPDRRIDIKYAVAEGDTVMVLFQLSGTHTGPFQDVPATGRPFSVWLSDIFRFDADGLMIEGWVIGKGDLRNALAHDGKAPR